MPDTDTSEIKSEAKAGKSSKLPMVIGLFLALTGGGGGFFMVYSGALLSGADPTADSHAETIQNEPVGKLPDVAFVPVDPIIVSVGSGDHRRHLRFRAQIEVATQYQSDVEVLLPRVIDVLNNYLRAIEPADFEDGSSLVRLRAQMLRRIRIVVGHGRVQDLLIMEFVLT